MRYTKRLPFLSNFLTKLYEHISICFECKQQTLSKKHKCKQARITYLKVNEIHLTNSEKQKGGAKKQQSLQFLTCQNCHGTIQVFLTVLCGIFILIMCVFMIPVRVHRRNYPANLLAKSLWDIGPHNKKVTLSF